MRSSTWSGAGWTHHGQAAQEEHMQPLPNVPRLTEQSVAARRSRSTREAAGSTRAWRCMDSREVGGSVLRRYSSCRNSSTSSSHCGGVTAGAQLELAR